MRSRQLIPLIQYNKPKYIVEVGFNDPELTGLLCQTALQVRPDVTYLAIIDKADDRSVLLDKFKKEFPDFQYEVLTEKLDGFEFNQEASKETFAIVNGLDAKNQHLAFKNCKVLVFDNYYQEDEKRRKPEGGSSEYLDSIDDCLIMPGNDQIESGGMIHMAVTPQKAWPGKVNIVIKTRNCVPSENILANVKYASTLIKDWMIQTAPHNFTAVVVSGGPSFRDYAEEIRELASRPDHFLFCVKTSHDWLIEQGIIPFGCFLLDPRPHVLDFIENPHKEIKYFCATMCHPVTVDKVVNSGAKVYGYNALVGSGEEEVVKREGKSPILVGGGSTAAIRGISVLNAIGFKRFELFGFDSCYDNKPDEVHGFNKKKKAIETEIAGRKFWTDPELLAQAQDFDKLIKQSPHLDINLHGDGMIQHIWLSRPQFPDFKETYCQTTSTQN